MIYKHTQIGYLMIFVLLSVIIFFEIILMQIGMNSTIIIFMFIILFILMSFTSLSVIVDTNYLKIKFGYGIFKKRFMLKKIISARIVKNHWYYGWGIRLWLFPLMWIYNVSGFNAVEIRMQNGKIFRIGTDEPKNLEYAITQAINNAR